jgi:hypothetical protein
MEENISVSLVSLQQECNRIKDHMKLHSRGSPDYYKEYEEYEKFCRDLSTQQRHKQLKQSELDQLKRELDKFTKIAQQYNDTGAVAAVKRIRPAAGAVAVAATLGLNATSRPKFVSRLNQSQEIELFCEMLDKHTPWLIPPNACLAGLDSPHDLAHARIKEQKGDVEDDMRDALLNYFSNFLKRGFNNINDVISYLTTLSNGTSVLRSMTNYEWNVFNFMFNHKYTNKFPGQFTFKSLSYADLLRLRGDVDLAKLQKYDHLKVCCPDDEHLSKYVEKANGPQIGLILIKLFFPNYTDQFIRFIVDGPHGGAFIKFLRWIKQVRHTVTVETFLDSSSTSTSMLAKATEYYPPSPNIQVSYENTPLIAVHGITMRLECDPTRFNSKDTTGIKVYVEKIKNDKKIALVYDFTDKPWKQGASVTDVMAACVAAFKNSAFTHKAPSSHMDLSDFKYYEDNILMNLKSKGREDILREFLNQAWGAAAKGSGDPCQTAAAKKIQQENRSGFTIYCTCDVICAAESLAMDLPTVFISGNICHLFKPRTDSASRTPLTPADRLKQQTQEIADKLFTDSMTCKPLLEWLSVPDFDKFGEALEILSGIISKPVDSSNIPASKAHIIKNGTAELRCLTAVRALCGMELSVINTRVQRVLKILKNDKLLGLRKSFVEGGLTQSLIDLQKFNEEYDTDPFSEFDHGRLSALRSLLESTRSAELSVLDIALNDLVNPKVLKAKDNFLELIKKTLTFQFWDCNGKNLEILRFDTSLYDCLLQSLISFNKATGVSRRALFFKQHLIDSISSNDYWKLYKTLIRRFSDLDLDTSSLAVFEVPPNIAVFDDWIGEALKFGESVSLPGASASSSAASSAASSSAASSSRVAGAGSALFGTQGGAYNKNGRKKRIIMNGGTPSILQNIETNILYHRMTYGIYQVLRNVINVKFNTHESFDNGSTGWFDIIKQVIIYINDKNSNNIENLIVRLSIIFADFVNDLLKIQMSSDYEYEPTIVDESTAILMDVILSLLFGEALTPVRHVYPVLLFTHSGPDILPEKIKDIDPEHLLAIGLVALSSTIIPYKGDLSTEWNPDIVWLTHRTHGAVQNVADDELEPNDPFEIIKFISQMLDKSTITKESFDSFVQFCSVHNKEDEQIMSNLLRDMQQYLMDSNGLLNNNIKIKIGQILKPIVGELIKTRSPAQRNGRVYAMFRRPDRNGLIEDSVSSDSGPSVSSQPTSDSEPESDLEVSKIPEVISEIISNFKQIFYDSATNHEILNKILEIIKSNHMGGASSRAKNKITKRNCRNVRRYKKSTPLSKSARKHKYKTINITEKKNRKNRTQLIRDKSYRKHNRTVKRRKSRRHHQ